MKTMRECLLDLMLRQYVTPLDALKHCQCFSLSQRAGEMRADRAFWDQASQAYKAKVPRPPLIVDKWVKLSGGKRVKAYRAIK